MTDTEQYAADRLENAIEEARLDELRKPDPCGTGMTIVLQAIEKHVREETASLDTYARMQRETHDPSRRGCDEAAGRG